MILATVKQRRGDQLGAREMYAASSASLESSDHLYREAFLALTQLDQLRAIFGVLAVVSAVKSRVSIAAR